MITREKIENVLIIMGMPVNIKGFAYIVECILFLEQEPDVKITYLYYKVSQKYETTASRVERAIRHAFEIARNCKADYEMVEHYIGFMNCANAASLFMLRLRIKEELKEEKKSTEGIAREEQPVAGITEERLLELMSQSQEDFFRKIICRLQL
jgi:hypothetical protein